MRPGEQLAAESRADKPRYDFDIFPRCSEYLRQDILMVHYALRALVQHVFLSVPYRNGGVHLHRVVGLYRGDVSLVDLHWGRGERALGIAALAHNARAAGLTFGRQVVG